jgi:hypothetical protein
MPAKDIYVPVYVHEKFRILNVMQNKNTGFQHLKSSRGFYTKSRSFLTGYMMFESNELASNLLTLQHSNYVAFGGSILKFC